MRVCLMVALAAAFLATGLAFGEDNDFISNPDSPELRALAKPIEVDESEYGAGEMREPGRTFYVAKDGDDAADGLSWGTAWRTVGRGARVLRAGDTLLIGEGEYEEKQIDLSARAGVQGEPGRPIRIWAAPRARVVMAGARKVDEFSPLGGSGLAWKAPLKGAGLPMVAWESHTRIMLQYTGALERLRELPGTFWIDPEAEELYVRFSDSRLPEGRSVRVRDAMHAFSIRSSRIHLKGITFTHYNCAVAIQNGSDHVTVEKCAFFANDEAGVKVRSAQRCLLRENYGRQSGRRGSVFMTNPRRERNSGVILADNLIIRNRFHSSALTRRTSTAWGHYCIHHWNGSGLRNHVVDNLLDDRLSLWYKPPHRQVVIEGNVTRGTFSTNTGTSWFEEPSDQMVVRSNTLIGGVSWGGEPFGPGGPGGDWAGSDKAFVNNFRPSRDLGVEEAKFADPAYHDYRLQGDSPLLGLGMDGGERGASRRRTGRVRYVGPGGDDAAKGDAASRAWKTLSAATGKLEPGDTLYVLPGSYDEPLVVRPSGEEGRPIRVRAYGRGAVNVPKIEILGARVAVEGFTATRAEGDAAVVRAPDVTLRRCLLARSDGAGVRGVGAARLTLIHCTLADNAAALRLEEGSSGARVRDSILSTAQGSLVECSTDSSDFAASHNCYFGPGAKADRIAAEMRSVMADPLFVDAAAGDYSVRWDSPAATRSVFGRAAGSEAASVRVPRIEDLAVSSLQPDSAVIRWRTPLDDTFGEARCRRRGRGRWTETSDSRQGTVHGVGLVGLAPGTEYEYSVTARGRRGGETDTRVAVFRTPLEAPASRVFHVSPDGDDEADGLSKATAWRTLRKASLEAAPGDTVLVAPGLYRHRIDPLRGGTPERRIVFRREGDGIVHVHGGGTVAPLANLVGVNYVTIDGFTFDIGVGNLPQGGSPPQLSPGGVFRVSNCEGIEILNCRGGYERPLGRGAGSNFLNAGKVRDLLVEGCVSWEARYHLWFHDVVGLTVRNNTFVHSQIISFIVDGVAENIRIENNIWYRPCGMATKNNPFYLLRGRERPDMVSDYNLFYSPVANHQKIADLRDERRQPVWVAEDLESWQEKTGRDRSSFRADPMFVDLKKGDFRLKPESPAIGAGRDGGNLGELEVAD